MTSSRKTESKHEHVSTDHETDTEVIDEIIDEYDEEIETDVPVYEDVETDVETDTEVEYSAKKYAEKYEDSDIDYFDPDVMLDPDATDEERLEWLSAHEDDSIYKRVIKFIKRTVKVQVGTEHKKETIHHDAVTKSHTEKTVDYRYCPICGDKL